MEVLSKVSELSFNYFESKDIVRHPVVAKVVQAYEEWEAQDEIRRQESLRSVELSVSKKCGQKMKRI